MRLGIDIGGTFTDCAVAQGDGRLVTLKVPSTPTKPEDGVNSAIDVLQLPVNTLERFVHGTTIVTNLLVERTGGRVALVTTGGFEDVLEMQGGDKPNTYDTTWRKPEPFVPRPRRLGVAERVSSTGQVIKPLTTAEQDRVIAALQEMGCDAIAISFLNAHLNPTHEQAMARAIARAFPRMHCCISTGVDPAVREYERTSTTVLNAYAMPRITDYIRGREADWGEVHYASSSGGAVSADVAARVPISLAFSGPAGGVGGASALSRAAGYTNVITFDMGGTSTDVAIVRNGEALIRQHTEIEWGIPYRFPSLDIKSVGAGGGSIVWLDSGGALRVGPRSAGAQPGPACYGHGGGEPAVTDLNLLLGLLPSRRLGYGSISLEPDAAEGALSVIAERLGLSTLETTYGAWRIVNATMAQAIREVTVYKGIDPRDFSLFCFGSAAGQHAAAVAQELKMPRVIVPAAAPVFSAVGLLATRLEVYGKRAIGTLLPSAYQGGELQRLASNLETELQAEQPVGGLVHRLWSLECRQEGQTHSIDVAYAPGEDTEGDVRERFRAEHARLYGVPGTREIELVTLRLTLAAPRPDFQSWRPTNGSQETDPLPATRSVFTEQATVPVHDRRELPDGATGSGPCLVADHATTVYVPAEARWQVDAFGSLVLDL